MKTISLHVDETSYAELKALAAARGRPVSELIREAMDGFVARERTTGASALDLAPHRSGPLLRPWSRAELMDEMRRR
jgi:hypothetical protein